MPIACATGEYRRSSAYDLAHTMPLNKTPNVRLVPSRFLCPSLSRCFYRRHASAHTYGTLLFQITAFQAILKVVLRHSPESILRDSMFQLSRMISTTKINIISS